MLAVGVLVLTLPMPWQSVRRRTVRSAARLFLFLAGMRLTVLHLERIPAEACVVVANHSSYLDGIVLFAALPPVFGFVIKREMSRVPLANLLLRQIGAHFVDRGQGNKGARDTRKLLKQAASGGSLAFFPEGHVPHHARPDAVPCRRISGRRALGIPGIARGHTRLATGVAAWHFPAQSRAHRDRNRHAHCSACLHG